MSQEQSNRRVEYGDWQTPLDLCRSVLALLRRQAYSPAAIVEPTCGQGSFLVAASEVFPDAQLHGYEINPSYISAAKEKLAGAKCQLHAVDFFRVDWEKTINELGAPLLLLGNPPWVTSADLGAIGSTNLPVKANFKNLSGLDAVTGKGNFDISEWMIVRLISSLTRKRYTLCMLCKTAVARRVLEFAASNRISVSGAVYKIDAKKHFGASVDAVLLKVDSHPTGNGDLKYCWPVFNSVDDAEPESEMGFVDGRLLSDVRAYARTRALEGHAIPPWRSGLKHDCSRVMEFRTQDNTLVNGADEAVVLEDDYLFPLVKGSDLANGRIQTERKVLVTQRFLGENTAPIRQRAPQTWDYLCANTAALNERKSSIYRGQPPYAIFGVGDYTFAPYKVAICGLYKRLSFSTLAPVLGKPTIVDDTCYFLPFDSLDEATEVCSALNSTTAKEFFEARIFWDAKRPITKAVLQSLDIDRLLHQIGSPMAGHRIAAKRAAHFHQAELGI